MIHSINKKHTIISEKVANVIGKTTGETAALIIASIALSILSPPFMVAIGGVLIAKVFIIIAESTKNSVMHNFLKKAVSLDTKFPNLKTIVLIFTACAFLIHPVFGVCASITAGVYIGIVNLTFTKINTPLTTDNLFSKL